MLTYCPNCKGEHEIKLDVKNKYKPTCTNCNTITLLNPIMINQMMTNRDYWEKTTGDAFKSFCQACDRTSPIKLDKSECPRCMECGTSVPLTNMMIDVMKGKDIFMTEIEFQKISALIKLKGA